jgi:hypothetical protein
MRRPTVTSAARCLPIAALALLAATAMSVAGCGKDLFASDDEPMDGYPVACEARPDDGCPDKYWTCMDGNWLYSGDGLCGACPALEPAEGQLCDDEGGACKYTSDLDCGPQVEVRWRCDPTGWTRVGDNCPPPCPDALPLAGSDCEGWSEAVCTFPVDAGCGATTATASCASLSGTPPVTWQVELASPCAACTAAEPEACAASACRWLEPGCGDEPAVVAGCYPLDDCTTESCGADLECSTVSVDPCWSFLCEACHEPAAVCTPVASN